MAASARGVHESSDASADLSVESGGTLECQVNDQREVSSVE
jgi:hypothetical protein